MRRHLAGKQSPGQKGRSMIGPIFDTHAHYSARAFDPDRFALLDSLPSLSLIHI